MVCVLFVFSWVVLAVQHIFCLESRADLGHQMGPLLPYNYHSYFDMAV